MSVVTRTLVLCPQPGGRTREVTAMTAVLDDRAVDDLLADVPVRAAFAPVASHDATSAPPSDSTPVAARFPSAAFASRSSAPASASSPALVWADSGHGSRPDTAPVPGPDVRVVDLGWVEEFPLPNVDLA